MLVQQRCSRAELHAARSSAKRAQSARIRSHTAQCASLLNVPRALNKRALACATLLPLPPVLLLHRDAA